MREKLTSEKNFMKRTMILLVMLIGMAGLTACTTDNSNPPDATVQDSPEKIYEDVAAENFEQVNISGNSKSIVIRRSESENFEFYNGDLNTAHTYTVRCDKKGEMLSIEILMESPDEDNDILGSPIIDIPRKEFEEIVVAGDFRVISIYALDSDVLVHADNSSVVYLDLEAEYLTHNITLDGSASDSFKDVSIYFDKFPDNISMDLGMSSDGIINDPDDILKENGLESGSGKPIISINYAEKISIYSKE